MKSLVTLITLTIVGTSMTGPAPAETRTERLDRLEDRIDRRESIRDERFDRGPLDVIEDRIDRRESHRDRLDKPTSRVVNRWERRSIRARFGQH